MLHPIDTTQRKAALVAGLMFLFVIVGSMIYMSFVRPKLIVPPTRPLPPSTSRPTTCSFGSAPLSSF